MKYFWYTFYPYQEKLQNFWVYMPFKVRIIKKWHVLECWAVLHKLQIHLSIYLLSFFFPLCYRFSDKTKNDWEDRHNFQKVPGKYDLLIMDYNADEEEKDSVDAPVKEQKPVLESKLDKRIQNLIELICNVQAMEEMLKEMKYDTKKAPLGQCSSNLLFILARSLTANPLLSHVYGDLLSSLSLSFPHPLLISASLFSL